MMVARLLSYNVPTATWTCKRINMSKSYDGERMLSYGKHVNIIMGHRVRPAMATVDEPIIPLL